MRLLPLACLFLAFAPAAHADLFNVTRTDDPLPDTCVPADCSLREAMLAAGDNDPFAETDEIALPAGTYALVRGPLPAVYQPLQVQGVGSAQTHIAFGDDNETLLEAKPDSNLTLVGLGLDASGEYAHALLASSDSILSLDDVVVENGAVTFSAESTVEVRHSELRRGLDCLGDALIEDSTLFNLYQMSPQTGTPATTLRRVLVDGTLNPDAPLPSAVVLHAGTLDVETSTLSDTTLRIFDVASVDVRDSTITRSKVAIDVAGSTLGLHRVHYIDNTGPIRTEAAATVTIEDSLFEANQVRALYAAGGAEWNISGSSFVDNLVDGNAGGAIVLEDNTELRIRNSTFAGNSFSVDAAADGARGAAIGYRNGSGAQLILQHVTIVPPSILPIGIVGTAIGGHGSGVTVDVSNTIVRGSCGMNNGALQNNVGNIEAPGDSCDFDPQFNLVNVPASDLALGTLGAHGGATPTYLPAIDSAAIDQASTPQCLPTDQTGIARPGGLRCDVGAVEADAVLFADGFDGT